MRLNLRVVGLLILFPVLTWAQVATDVKVVFLKGTALMTANADGSNAKQLLDDGVAKDQPHWSPAGDKIVYDTPSQGTNPQETTDDLVVITASGQLVKTIPHHTGADWAFSVDQIGWYGNSGVFVTGRVNPWTKAYIALDLNSGQASQDLEAATGEDDGFETCSSNAQVVFQMDNRDLSDNPSVSVQVNGSAVYTPQQTPLPFFHELHWFADCTRLAFIESRSASDILVVLSGKTPEARIPWPASVPWPLTFSPVGSSFMVRGSPSGALFYDTTTHTLRAAPDILQQLQQRDVAEAQVMKALGGQSPDWYRTSGSHGLAPRDRGPAPGWLPWEGRGYGWKSPVRFMFLLGMILLLLVGTLFFAYLMRRR